MSLLSRALGFEDWKKSEGNIDKNKFDYHWRNLPPTKKAVRCSPFRALPYLMMWVLDQPYEAREKELVRFYHLRYQL